MRTIDDLRQMQALPLSLKVSLTKARIRQWVNEYGENGVYVSFSGGKDSTVLLHIVREMYPDIPAVFVNTGLEYPEIVQFVKTFDNVEILRPDMNFKKVIEKYGYPMFSKEISSAIGETAIYLQKINGGKGGTNVEKLISLRNENALIPVRAMQMLGEVTRTDGNKSQFNFGKYLFCLDAPFKFSNRCCGEMKKKPAHKYGRTTGRKPFTAQMASESRQRTAKWLQNGCNGFNLENPISNPMSFWKEQDVLQYIKQNNIAICSVYGDIVPNDEKNEYPEGQTMLQLDGSIVDAPCELKTTGCNRTGCMFCGFGCHVKGDTRFADMKQTHPRLYEWIMKPWSDGGLGYKEVIDWINEHGELDIKY